MAKVQSLIKIVGVLSTLFVVTLAIAQDYYDGYDDRRDRESSYSDWRRERDLNRAEDSLQRERYELERDRDRLEAERNRLESERREPSRPVVETCPAGFSPSEQKCSPQERKRGCKDMRLPGGLGCVHR